MARQAEGARFVEGLLPLLFGFQRTIGGEL